MKPVIPLTPAQAKTVAEFRALAGNGASWANVAKEHFGAAMSGDTWRHLCLNDYRANPAAKVRLVEQALNALREKKRRESSAMAMGTFLDLPRFAQIYSGIERNARTTDKRRGAAYIGDTGAGKSALCAHVAQKYRAAKNAAGDGPMFDEVIELVCTSAWRSEQAFYTLLAAKLGIGNQWRGLFFVQDAVGRELAKRGRVFFVIDEFQVEHNAIFKAFKWLENETPARWFVAGNQSLYDRMSKNSKTFPNAEQFEARTLPIHRLDHLTPGDVAPFVRSFASAGATMEEPEDVIVQRVVEHAREFGRFNLVADTLPKYIAARHANRWSLRTIDAAVREVRELHGREDAAPAIARGAGRGFVTGSTT